MWKGNGNTTTLTNHIIIFRERTWNFTSRKKRTRENHSNGTLQPVIEVLFYQINSNMIIIIFVVLVLYNLISGMLVELLIIYKLIVSSFWIFVYVVFINHRDKANWFLEWSGFSSRYFCFKNFSKRIWSGTGSTHNSFQSRYVWLSSCESWKCGDKLWMNMMGGFTGITVHACTSRNSRKEKFFFSLTSAWHDIPVFTS